MIVKKRVSVGNYAKKKKDYNDGDLLTILDEGKEIEGRFGMQTVFKVKLTGGEFAMPINATSLENLADEYGEDTREWIGKEARVWLVKQNVAGKIVDVAYLTHKDKTLEDYQEGADGEEAVEM